MIKSRRIGHKDDSDAGMLGPSWTIPKRPLVRIHQTHLKSHRLAAVCDSYFSVKPPLRSSILAEAPHLPVHSVAAQTPTPVFLATVARNVPGLTTKRTPSQLLSRCTTAPRKLLVRPSKQIAA
jgi:hypothetical protein